MPLFDAEPEGWDGINAFHAREIAPGLRTIRDRRKQRLRAIGRKAIWALPLALVAGGATAAAQAALGQAFGMAVFFLPGVILVLGGVLAVQHLSGTEQARKSLILGKLAAFQGLTYSPGGHPDLLAVARRKSLVADGNETSCEDGLEGAIRGVSFRFTEALVVRRRRDKDGDTRRTTRFRGFLMSVAVPKAFSGRTVLYRNSLLPRAITDLFSGLDSVRLEDPDFERRFDVVSSDQVEARYLLTGTMMRRFTDLATRHPGMTASFEGGSLLLVCPADDLFEPGSVWLGPDDDAATIEIIHELGLFAAIVETLALDTKSRI